MNVFFRKFFGFSLVFVAVIGMIFCITGIVGIWSIISPAQNMLVETTALIKTTLQTTSDGLIIVDDTLTATTDTLAATVQTTETIANTLVDISVLADGIINFANLFGGAIETPNNQETSLVVEIDHMTNNLQKVNNNLDEAREIVDSYQISVEDAIIQIEYIQDVGPSWITALAIVITIILVWLAIAQIGLILQGVNLIRKQ